MKRRGFWILVLCMTACPSVQAAEKALLSPYDTQTGVCQMAQRGMNFERSGDFVRALSAFEAAQRIETRNIAFGIFRARSLIGLGQFKEAEKTLNTIRELAPDESQTWLHLGILYAKWGRLEDARRRLMAAHRLDPASPWITLNLAQLYALGLDPARAAALLEGPDLDVPSDSKVWRWNNLSVAQFKLGNKAAALQSNYKAFKHLPSDRAWSRDVTTPRNIRALLENNQQVIQGKAPSFDIQYLVEWNPGPGPNHCPIPSKPKVVE